MLSVIPQPANDWLKNPNPLNALGSFPPNLAFHLLTPEVQKDIMRFMYDNYIWPQILERQVFESMWQKLLDMYRIKLDKIDQSIDESSQSGRQLKEDLSGNRERSRLADSVMYDSVERLTDITHFISFKEGTPIQYNIPEYYDTRGESMFYHPMKDKIQAANSLLAWSIDNEEVYRKHLVAARHFYLYGVAFAKSEFQFQVTNVQRMTNLGRQVVIPEINKIGTTFEPLSIWKLWLNWRLSAFDMEYQPCPFYFEETPRFATLQNVYDPRLNPFGFANLEQIANYNCTWLYTGPEMQGFRQQLDKMVGMDNQPKTIPQLLQDEFSVEALWTFYPMLPLDSTTLEWKTRKDGSPVPMQRYVMNTWGENLCGKQIILRLQRNFYPRDTIPLYGTSHMPDLDSGLYTPSLGYLLWNHYREIVTCKQQYIDNKDLINNPPHWVLGSSPAADQDLTRAGNKITTSGPRDFGYMEIKDATQTTAQFMIMLRDQAKTSAKSEDALLGKAMGGRTSATEAQNVFQASMSAVTTPINLFNYDIMGGYAVRVWEYTATWFPPDLLKSITGQMGFALSPQDLWMRVGLKWDVASTYIESIVRQQNIRYMLESSMGDPAINRAPMWKALLREWRFDTADEWVNDGGLEQEVYKSTNQAIEAYMGLPVFIDPDQNHQIAIEVKKAFLEDRDSVWNTKYPQNAPEIIKQIEQHQKLYMMQMQLRQAQLEASRPIGSGGQPALPPQGGNGGGQQPPLQNQNQPTDAGGMAQQGGGMV